MPDNSGPSFGLGHGKTFYQFIQSLGPDTGRAVVYNNNNTLILAGYSFNGVNLDFSAAELNYDGSFKTDLAAAAWWLRRSDRTTILPGM